MWGLFLALVMGIDCFEAFAQPFRPLLEQQQACERPASQPLAAGAAVSGLFDYFGQLIEIRRADPGADTISALVATAPLPTT